VKNDLFVVNFNQLSAIGKVVKALLNGDGFLAKF
jgi:hypothetical protein